MGIAGISVPEGCDCCGRDAEDCEMLETGWVTDSELIPSGAVFCRKCAHLLHLQRHAEFCAWCDGLMAQESRTEAIGWAYLADELGDLHPCCPGCLADRFGIVSRIAHRRSA
jgi:hypothetical protein